jgi:hypothetical protein
LLVWLERDFVNPGSLVGVYVFYGRFETFFGSNGGPVRVRADDAFEQTHIGSVKAAIIDYALHAR